MQSLLKLFIGSGVAWTLSTAAFARTNGPTVRAPTLTNLQIANYNCNAIAYVYGLRADQCRVDLVRNALDHIDTRDSRNIYSFWKAARLTEYQFPELRSGESNEPGDAVMAFDTRLFLAHHLFGY